MANYKSLLTLKKKTLPQDCSVTEILDFKNTFVLLKSSDSFPEDVFSFFKGKILANIFPQKYAVFFRAGMPYSGNQMFGEKKTGM